MRIQNNLSAIFAQNKLASNNVNLSKSIEKLSSGFRLNRQAGLDTAAIDKIRGDMAKLNAPIRFKQDTVSLMQTAEGALSHTTDLLNRMRQLASQSSNHTNSDSDRVELQQEFDNVAKEVTRIGESTSFNGYTLLDGSKEVQTESAVYGPENRYVKFNDMRAEALGVADLSLSSVDSSRDAISKIEEALNLVNEQRSAIGNEQNRLISESISAASNTENLNSAESRIRDADMAQEMASFTKHLMLSQAGSAILSQANSLPNGALSLLRG